MQKAIKYLTRYPVIILILLVIPSFITLVRPGYFPMHDDLQAFRIHQMHECFKDYQLPCRWVPDMGYQYGYPQYNYYPPSVYYLGEAFHLIGFQFIDSAKIIFALGFLVSALTMYLFLRDYLSKWAGLIGALVYTYIPYKAVNVYVRGALNEFWALAFYPLLFWSSWKIVKEGGRKNIAFFAISTFLILITHNLMTLIFLPILGVWILLNVLLEKNYRSLIGITLGGILGVGLAAFFTLPVFVEQSYAHLETLVGGYFDYRQHFVSINQLLVSNFWGYDSSVWGIDDGMSLSAGQIQVAGSVIALLFALVSFKKFRNLSIITIFLFGLELMVLFMIHQKSSPIWTFFESTLIFIQFPWRFLSLSTFLTAVLCAIGVFFIQQIDFKIFKVRSYIVFSLVLVISCLILYLPFFKPNKWYDITDTDKFSGISWEKQLTISIFDYLPIYAKFPPTSAAPMNPETLEGLADFKEARKGSNFKSWTVEVSNDSLLRAPIFDYPGMKVFVDGIKVDHWNDDCRNQEFCLGLVTFKVPQGNHEILIKLTNTPIRVVGNLLTVVSLIILMFLLFPKKHNFSAIKYIKKWLR
jgi:hypothetical protein